MAASSRTASVWLNERAVAEVTAALRQYESLRPGYGWVLQRRLDETLAHIAEHPECYQKVNGRYRRAFLTRFPFMVIYRIRTDGVEVVGLLPQRADPKTARRRAASNA